ncbi:MAG: TRAP transporter substrate-binding protein DctP [Betaproteobacteria bacterium]|nr:TRAP transporter substrate-binding protein DctP [Betaproteobacteria bacterium]MDH4326157.1 TRAP transporter substrate-binding protein DctP [Betaproteobacteria bacterium]
MKLIRLQRLPMAAAMAVAAAGLVAGFGAAQTAHAQGQPQKVVLRFAADFPPPPHPAGLAMKYFAERLPQVIPGSEARLYFAGALYTVPEAFEAMRQGNLEMTWMQIGKAAPVDPWMMALVGPGILTTVGAVDNLEKTQTYQMLTKRLEQQQLIKVFGAGHMSFGMGIGGKKRYAKPGDFVGSKLRSMGPVENASLSSWKANPVVMGFGEVPSALESGVIDGLMTSLGGWNSVREQAPFFTMGGAGAFIGDYYMVSASRRWWDRLTPATRGALEKLIAETVKVQKEYNWCFDKMAYDKYGTKDPSKPGIYWMTPDEVGAMVTAMGDAPTQYVKTKTPQAANSWVDTFVKEGREMSKQHPTGTSWIEKVDCSRHASSIVIK